MMDPFEAEDMSLEAKEAWQALDHLPETTVSDRFEARLMARIADLESSQTRESLFQSATVQHWLKSLDGIFDFLHMPALAILIALLFWLPTSSIQTAHRLDFPSLDNPRSMQNQETYIFEPQKILKLLIYISRS